jgi:hypothetical protein
MHVGGEMGNLIEKNDYDWLILSRLKTASDVSQKVMWTLPPLIVGESRTGTNHAPEGSNCREAG